MKFAFVSAPAETAGGTQDFTVAGFGTPKAAIFISSRATSAGQATLAHASLSVGFTDGTRQAVVNTRARDNNASNYAGERGATDEVHLIANVTSSAAIDGEANFDSWITDGVRLNWGNAPSLGWQILCILIGGDGDAYVGTVDATAADQDVTAPGFEPSLVFTIATIADNFADTGTNSRSSLSLGLSTSSARRSMVLDMVDASGTSSHTARFSTAHSAYGYGGMASAAIDIVDFDASGFTADIPDGFPDGLHVGYLALGFTNPVHVGHALGDQGGGTTVSYEDPGFAGESLLMVSSALPSVDTDTTSGPGAEAVGVGFADASGQFSCEMFAEDGGTPAQTSSGASNTAVQYMVTTGGATHRGVASLDSLGFNVDWDDTGSDGHFFYALIGLEPTGTPGTAETAITATVEASATRRRAATAETPISAIVDGSATRRRIGTTSTEIAALVSASATVRRAATATTAITATVEASATRRRAATGETAISMAVTASSPAPATPEPEPRFRGMNVVSGAEGGFARVPRFA